MKTLNAKYVQDEITALLLAYPELAEDDVLRADTIEGETSTFEFLSSIVQKIDDNNDIANGTTARISQLSNRLSRLNRRETALRALCMRIMNTANIKKAELPEATLSIRNGQQKVVIIAEGAIPDEFMRVIKEPDRARIKAAITAHEVVPGAVLSNAEPHLAILR